MNRSGPIIIIEDDRDDRELLSVVFKRLKYKNEIIYFENGELALDYFTNTDIEPFIIISDINMPKMNGLELRDKIHLDEDLRSKCTPYVFFTTSAIPKHIAEAYCKSIQGFFVKPDELEKLQRLIKLIVEYWQECVSPDYFKSPAKY